ncbi:MAG: MBL fold metallo-hydrolase [Bacteroidota bacterium]
MQLQLIRNATMRMTYARRTFITDPYLAAKHSRPSYRGIAPNPLVDLPCAPHEAIAGIEMAIVSHLHSDHFDPAARDLLPKDVDLLCPPEDSVEMETRGFRHVLPVVKTIDWQGITITRTPCRHGSGDVLKEMGEASGFVFQADGEPTVYWVGDSIWYGAVAEVISGVKPEIIITHSGGAVWGDGVPIVMDAPQTTALCHAAPNSIVIAVHMEALDHTTVSRQALRDYAEANGIGPERLLIPWDGERLVF